jgi:hypothetical protein
MSSTAQHPLLKQRTVGRPPREADARSVTKQYTSKLNALASVFPPATYRTKAVGGVVYPSTYGPSRGHSTEENGDLTERGSLHRAYSHDGAKQRHKRTQPYSLEDARPEGFLVDFGSHRGFLIH